MSSTPEHQEAWDHKRAIWEYEQYLEAVFDRIGGNPSRTKRRKDQFREIYEDPELWRDPDSFKKLYEDLRKEIIALGQIHMAAMNKHIRETFGPNSPHIVEPRL
ncbi:hypothetical protein [Henriciella pelagia]|jgi:hypothetical protein|uniref:Uncharacterized protein n=1 Tax=Henriciella pelagia TaxID=1977912 RepID=A0ABQ1JCQ8_9PROT|nr:hypothetical protein [Henriciella pelagia]GGB64075.1 hypothetical protein GCM10011503_11060 [Henriciella pelagia]